MPLKLALKSRIFSRSCVDLSSTRGGDGDSEIIVAVGFRGSQIALGQVGVTSGGSSTTSGKTSKQMNGKLKSKPDVVHWKRKVCEIVECICI